MVDKPNEKQASVAPKLNNPVVNDMVWNPSDNNIPEDIDYGKSPAKDNVPIIDKSTPAMKNL